MKKEILILRIAIAFAFLYVAYAALKDPISWLAFIPASIVKNFPQTLLLSGLAIGHSAIGLWLLSGWKIFWPSLLASIYLFATVAFNIPQIDIVFRDISLGLVALALAFSSRAEIKKDFI